MSLIAIVSLTLGIAGLISGLALVAAYEVTLPRITANKAEALRKAVFEVVPGAADMQGLSVTDGRLTPATEGAGFYAGYGADGKFVGFAIPGHGAGFQDTIHLIYGFDPSKKRIVGMRVLDSRETPGLGDKIFKDQAFVDIFNDLAVEPTVALVKKGKRQQPNEVEAITGATISSKAIVKIINATNATWLPKVKGEVPALPKKAPPPAKEEGS